MTYEEAAAKYLALRAEQDRISKAVKAQVADLERQKTEIENWFAVRAQDEGLTTIPTTKGTVYWSTHNSATCAEPAVFRQYVIDNEAWDLMETRPSKSAVKSHVEGHGVPPPGVNFSSIKVFNLRANHKE